MTGDVKHLLDIGSVTTLIATLAGWLPNVAAALTIVWTLIRIIESKTFKRIFGRKDP